MTDQLEALLLGQEPEDKETVWWKDRSMCPLPGRRIKLAGETAGENGEKPETEESVRAPKEERPERKGNEPGGEWLQEQTQGWMARELERVRKIARRAAQGNAGKEIMQRNGHRAEPFAQASAFAVLKDSPAAGRQGLTAQIDMQFRRDARRYDGRLGLL